VVLEDAMRKERRESFRKRHTEQPFVMPKRSMETIADLDRSKLPIQGKFIGEEFS